MRAGASKDFIIVSFAFRLNNSCLDWAQSYGKNDIEDSYVALRSTRKRWTSCREQDWQIVQRLREKKDLQYSLETTKEISKGLSRTWTKGAQSKLHKTKLTTNLVWTTRLWKDNSLKIHRRRVRGKRFYWRKSQAQK